MPHIVLVKVPITVAPQDPLKSLIVNCLGLCYGFGVTALLGRGRRKAFLRPDALFCFSLTLETCICMFVNSENDDNVSYLLALHPCQSATFPGGNQCAMNDCLLVYQRVETEDVAFRSSHGAYSDRVVLERGGFLE